MRFFVEETSFVLPVGVDAALLERQLDAFVQLVDARHRQNDEVFRWSKLMEETEVQPGIFLVDVLYQQLEDLPIDLTVRLGLQAALNRCLQWDERFEEAPEPLVEIAGDACTSPTGALVHARISTRHGAACLSLGLRPDRAGAVTVRLGAISHEVHFITQESHLPLFYRTLFELEDMQRDAYMENALDAFPQIAFVPELAAQLGGLVTDYRELRPIVTSHLAALNDHFPTVFKKHDGKPFETTRELGAICHIDVTPESPNTHRNKKAMKEREVEIDSVQLGRRRLPVKKTICCEWHTKIKPTTDRIHFHPGTDKVAEGKLIVGRFVTHFA